jgi:hypothetical protein
MVTLGHGRKPPADIYHRFDLEVALEHNSGWGQNQRDALLNHGGRIHLKASVQVPTGHLPQVHWN